MLYKNTLPLAALSAVLWGNATQAANVAVVASLEPLGFITSAIAGGVTDTGVLLSGGTSEHDYLLRPPDVKRLQGADLVVWAGLEIEAFTEKSVKNTPNTKQVTTTQLNDVKPLLMKGADDDDGDYGHNDTGSEKSDEHHHHGDYSMHLWLSSKIAWASAVAIHGKLVEPTPQSRTKLNTNLKDFEVQLTTTGKQVGNEFALLKGKDYFVLHDAYGYYEKYCGLIPPGRFIVNPKVQLGTQRLYEIRTQPVEQRAACVFIEPQSRPTVAGAVTRGTSVRVGTLDLLGTNIELGKTSYSAFLNQLANQYMSYPEGDQ